MSRRAKTDVDEDPQGDKQGIPSIHDLAEARRARHAPSKREHSQVKGEKHVVKHLKPEDIGEIWRDLDPTLIFDRTRNRQIADTIDLWNATTHGVAEQNREKLAPAHKVLTEWCAAHRREREEFLAEYGTTRFDPRMLALEAALAAVEDRVCALPTRQKSWRLVAPMVWQEAAAALQSKGRNAGTSANAVAVRFTSCVLSRIGYSEATCEAVRRVVEQFVAERNRLKV